MSATVSVIDGDLLAQRIQSLSPVMRVLMATQLWEAGRPDLAVPLLEDVLAEWRAAEAKKRC